MVILIKFLCPQMMKYTMILLAFGLAASVASADKPVYSAKPAAPAQHTASVSGGPSNNERWDENGSDGKSQRTLYYGDIAPDNSAGKMELVL